jgi:hypothetical protein
MPPFASAPLRAIARAAQKQIRINRNTEGWRYTKTFFS